MSWVGGFALCVLLSIAAAKECVRVNSAGLSFRAQANVNSNKIGAWNTGEVLEKEGGPVAGGEYTWYKLVNTRMGTGYSATNWLAPAACPGGSAPPAPAPGGSGSGSTGCAPPCTSCTSGAAFNTLPAPGAGIIQPYGRTPFSWSACAQWYKAAGCMHNGIDIGTRWGTEIKAVCSGPITASTDAGNGNPMSAGPKSVVLQCGNWLVLYGHMSSTYNGYKNEGQAVGLSGNPGGYNGAGNDHLHFEVRLKNSGSTTYSSQAVNPLPLFQSGLQGSMQPAGFKMACGDIFWQPDVNYGNAANCKQWCGCSGYC